MNKLTLSKTDFEYNHHEPTKAHFHAGYYVFHNMDAYHDIIINGNHYPVCYQNGHSFRCNDYSAPSNDFELYDEGSHALINLLNGLFSSDFEDEEIILEKLAEAKEIEPAINSIDKLWQVYEYLNDDMPRLEDFLEPHEFSYNVDDYIENEQGELTFKE